MALLDRHLVYLTSSSRQSPFAVFIHSSKTDSIIPIPGSTLFALLSLFLHMNLAIHLLPTLHPLRSGLVSLAPACLSKYIPLQYFWIFALSSTAPTLAVFLRPNLAEVLWWSSTFTLSLFVWSVQRWILQEENEIEKLEGMQYQAKGA